MSEDLTKHFHTFKKMPTVEQLSKLCERIEKFADPVDLTRLVAFNSIMESGEVVSIKGAVMEVCHRETLPKGQFRIIIAERDELMKYLKGLCALHYMRLHYPEYPDLDEQRDVRCAEIFPINKKKSRGSIIEETFVRKLLVDESKDRKLARSFEHPADCIALMSDKDAIAYTAWCIDDNFKRGDSLTLEELWRSRVGATVAQKLTKSHKIPMKCGTFTEEISGTEFFVAYPNFTHHKKN